MEGEMRISKGIPNGGNWRQPAGMILGSLAACLVWFCCFLQCIFQTKIWL